jgi:hypothetical protein
LVTTLLIPSGDNSAKLLCFETNPVKLLERIARARNAVLDHIEDSYSKPLNGEQAALRDALAKLDTLRKITERQNGYQSKAS